MPKTPKAPKAPQTRRRSDRTLLSTGDVARLCGVSRDGVLHWIHAGRLPAVRTPGGHFRVRGEDLELFLGRDTGPTAPRPPWGAAAGFTAVHDAAGKPCILIIDDGASLMPQVEGLLRRAGYRVARAAETNEALVAVADRGQPDGAGGGEDLS